MPFLRLSRRFVYLPPCHEPLRILLRLRRSKAMSREAMSSFSFLPPPYARQQQACQRRNYRRLPIRSSRLSQHDGKIQASVYQSILYTALSHVAPPALWFRTTCPQFSEPGSSIRTGPDRKQYQLTWSCSWI